MSSFVAALVAAARVGVHGSAEGRAACDDRGEHGGEDGQSHGVHAATS
jgi:hypothetical protein